MRTFAFFISLIFVAFAPHLTGQPTPDLENMLKADFVNKVFTLRDFYIDNNLHYNVHGVVLGRPDVGSWTASLVEIKNAKISVDNIVLEGRRWGKIYDSKHGKFVDLPTKQDVLITLDYNASEANSNVAEALNHIFLQQNDRLVDLVPEYWKPILLGTIGNAHQKDLDCSQIQGELTRYPDGSVKKVCNGDEKNALPASLPQGYDVSSIPYAGKRGVSPPHPKFTPDPKYYEPARLAKLQGFTVLKIVVKQDGTVSDIYISRPLGFGMDEEAVNAVKTWEFDPGSINNHPVPVRMTIQVAFHLYR